MSIPKKPLDVNDFSGGITDTILQGDPRRMAIADNYIITNDKKLEVRYGYVGFDETNYILPGRVNGSFAILNNSKLMFVNGRSVNIWEDTAFVAPTGPEGASPLQGGDFQSQVSIAEFQNQIYMTSDGADGTGIQPSKMYRDENNEWQVRTVGLPSAFVENVWSESTLLAACIELANALRASFLLHMTDYHNPTYTYSAFTNFKAISSLHANRDKYSLSYLQAESFISGDPETPSPVPTPAPAATTEASLYTLVTALNNAYNHHVADSTLLSNIQDPTAVVGGNGAPLYHIYCRSINFTTTFNLIGPAMKVVDNTTPDSLIQAAEQLNDLRQKWYFHRLAFSTHSWNNNYGFMNRHAVTVGEIANVQSKIDIDGSLILNENAHPFVTPDYSDLFKYVNNLKNLFLRHIGLEPSIGLVTTPTSVYGGGHTQIDTDYNNQYTSRNWDTTSAIGLPDCTDLNSMYLLIYWLRIQYQKHQQDLNYRYELPITATANGESYIGITFTTVAGSANVTAITKTSDGTTVTLRAGASIYDYAGSGFEEYTNSRTYNYYLPGFYANKYAQVVSAGAGTAVLDRRATASQTRAGTAQISRYHAYIDASVFPVSLKDTTSYPGSASAALASGVAATGTDVASWLDLADECFNAFATHGSDQTIHIGGSTYWTSLLLIAKNQPFFMPEVESVSYAFYFSDAYKVEPNGIDYLVRSAPIYTEPVYIGKTYKVGDKIVSNNALFYPDVINLSQITNVISGMAEIVNTSETNYDTDVLLNIYRTVDSGTVFYKLDQVSNGTNTYSDTTKDSDLETKQELYTTGGRLGDQQPPKAKFIHIVNGTAYYAGITDSGQYFPNRLVQAIQYAPDAAPGANFDDMDDEITGLSSARSNLIVFCKNSIYRESGLFNTLGQGALTHEKISDEIGCINFNSIVQTEIGVFFAGTDGFYYTDAYQIIKISLELDTTYKAIMSQGRNIYGTYDRLTRRVYWSVKQNPTEAQNSAIFVFYLNYGTKPSGVFTKFINPNFLKAASHVFLEGVHYVGHEDGYLLKSDFYTKTDPILVDWQAPSVWTREVIPYHYLSCAIDGGTTFNRKWSTKLHVYGDNTGNSSMQPYVIRDMNSDYKGIKPMAAINYIDNLIWGQPTCVWGDPDVVWNNKGKMDLWRRFPQTTLRADFLQIGFRPVDIAVYASKSGYYPEFTKAEILTDTTASLAMPSGWTDLAWPLDIVNMYIKFFQDDYVLSYKITELNSVTGVITFENPDLTLAIGIEDDFEIWGYRKEQRPTLSGYVIHYGLMGDAVQAYPGANSNQGPGNGGGNP